MALDYEKYDDLPEAYHRQSRPELLCYLPHDTRIVLDIGCGEGIFGGLIKKQREAEVWGVELFSKAAAKAKTVLDRVYVGNIETDKFDLPENYFDCIVFNDVLEHLYYPWDVLVQVKSLLRKHGYVMATIPNIRFYDQFRSYLLHGDWEYQKWGLMDRTHLRFFTRKSIEKMFISTGYDIVSLQGFNSIEFSWKLKLLNSFLGNRLDDVRHLQFVCIARI